MWKIWRENVQLFDECLLVDGWKERQPSRSCQAQQKIDMRVNDCRVWQFCQVYVSLLPSILFVLAEYDLENTRRMICIFVLPNVLLVGVREDHMGWVLLVLGCVLFEP
jgi:hypothetical protein